MWRGRSKSRDLYYRILLLLRTSHTYAFNQDNVILLKQTRLVKNIPPKYIYLKIFTGYIQQIFNVFTKNNWLFHVIKININNLFSIKSTFLFCVDLFRLVCVHYLKLSGWTILKFCCWHVVLVSGVAVINFGSKIWEENLGILMKRHVVIIDIGDRFELNS